MPTPDEPPSPEEAARMAELAKQVQRPESSMKMQPGEAQQTRPLPTYETRQEGLAEAGRQMQAAGTRQSPDQGISLETRATLERVFGVGGGGTPEPTPEGRPDPSPSNSNDLTPG